MSVSFRVCPNCKETYPDCIETLKVCGGCETSFCGCCDAVVENVWEEGTPETHDPSDGSCPICRMDVISDTDLLRFIISVVGPTRSEWEDMYRETKKQRSKK